MIQAGAKVDASDFAINSWTPVWSSTTLGSGATNVGWYTNVNGLVTAQFHVIFGTSPSFSATGVVDLPVPANVAGLQTALGSWVFRDNSAPTHFAGTIAGWDGGGLQASFSGAWNYTASLPHGRLGAANVLGGSGNVVQVGDTLSGQMTYRAA